MPFEISCYLRFHVIWICFGLFQITIEWFRILKPISGLGWVGLDGRLSPFDSLLRAPYGANNPNPRIRLSVRVHHEKTPGLTHYPHANTLSNGWIVY